jgi:predicted lipoprotein with Yx(FWY)xxD motif
VRSLTSDTSADRPSATRVGRLLGAVVIVAALGIAASVAVLGITSAPGSHAADEGVAGISVQAPAAGGHDMSGMAAGGDAAGGTGAAGTGADGMAGMDGMGDGGLELYAVQTGSLGIVVTDGAGRLLYGSVHDANNPPTSRCAGSGAQEWQPLVVPPGQQPQLLGVDARTVGRLARADGSSQLTLAGWPVYVNRDDDGGMKVTSPAAHGSWFVMTPQGGKIAV